MSRSVMVPVDTLRRVVDRALEDASFAEKVFADPDAVATEYNLSRSERLVVGQMNREQFETARNDAAAQPALAGRHAGSIVGRGKVRPPAGNMACDMIIGRSIIAASGGSYAGLATAGCDCCAWKGGISTGKGKLILPMP